MFQAGRGELLYRLSNQLNTWSPLLQRFLKSEDEQAHTFAEAHNVVLQYSTVLSCFSDTNCSSIANFGLTSCRVCNHGTWHMLLSIK